MKSPFKKDFIGVPAIWQIKSCFDTEEDRKAGLANNLKNLQYPEVREYFGIFTPKELAEAESYLKQMWAEPHPFSEPQYRVPW